MNLTVADAVVIVGAIMSFYSFIKVVRSPLSRIEQTERDVVDLKKELEGRKTIDRAMLNSLQAITNHMIDGNNTNKLKDSRDELQRAINEIATK